jgi:putative transposase
MVRFIDQHRDTYGVEPICAVLPIAPSTYFRQKAQEEDPTKRSAARAHDDDERRAAIRRVWDEHEQVYGPRKVWRQLRREGHRVARCRAGSRRAPVQWGSRSTRSLPSFERSVPSAR